MQSTHESKLLKNDTIRLGSGRERLFRTAFLGGNKKEKNTPRARARARARSQASTGGKSFAMNERAPSTVDDARLEDSQRRFLCHFTGRSGQGAPDSHGRRHRGLEGSCGGLVLLDDVGHRWGQGGRCNSQGTRSGRGCCCWSGSSTTGRWSSWCDCSRRGSRCSCRCSRWGGGGCGCRTRSCVCGSRGSACRGGVGGCPCGRKGGNDRQRGSEAQ